MINTANLVELFLDFRLSKKDVGSLLLLFSPIVKKADNGLQKKQYQTTYPVSNYVAPRKMIAQKNISQTSFSKA